MKAQKNHIDKGIMVIVIGFSILGLVFKLDYLIYGGLGIGVLSLISKKIEKLILKGWMSLALVLGWINGRILLSIIFYIFLTPIALLSRLFTKDPLKLKPQSQSTFEDRDHKYVPEDLENPW